MAEFDVQSSLKNEETSSQDETNLESEGEDTMIDNGEDDGFFDAEDGEDEGGQEEFGDAEEELLNELMMDEEGGEEEGEELENEDDAQEFQRQQHKTQSKKQMQEDLFFSFDRMEDFLKKAEELDKGEQDDFLNEDNHNEEEDFFTNAKGNFIAFVLKKDKKGMKYGDFFDAPDEDDNGDEFDNLDNFKQKKSSNPFEKKMRENLKKPQPLFEEDDEQIKGDDEFGHVQSMKQESKLDSKFEKKKQKLDETIATLEDQNLKVKEWALRGETMKKTRPENSLLETHLDFDVGMRHKPTATVSENESIESLIVKRIKEGLFDDVVKKKSISEKYRPKIELDQEKSKQSLAEVYEQEVLPLVSNFSSI
jgi:U3 small nucleolar RNA-associated protein MPP10